MSDAELLAAVKDGLGLQQATTEVDLLLKQKIKMVKAFLLGGGVREEIIYSDLSVGLIALGVGDIWLSRPGEGKLSEAFWVMARQQAMNN